MTSVYYILEAEKEENGAMALSQAFILVACTNVSHYFLPLSMGVPGRLRGLSSKSTCGVRELPSPVVWSPHPPLQAAPWLCHLPFFPQSRLFCKST